MDCPIRYVILGASGDRVGSSALRPLLTYRSYEKGEVVASSGVPQRDLRALASGLLRFTRCFADGRRQITAFLYPGDLVIHGDPNAELPADLEAVVPSTLCSIELSVLQALRRDDPQIDSRLLELSQDWLMRAHEHIAVLGTKTPLGRLAAFLLDLEQRAAQCGGDNGVVSVPMRRGEIADYLGLQTETVSRAFGKLVSVGAIDLPRPSSVIIRSHEMLEDLSEGMDCTPTQPEALQTGREPSCAA